MKEDKILQMAFQSERWQYAIQKGLDKDINKATLYQLTTPEARALMYQKIRDGKYRIMPPHTALIPKDNGEVRTTGIASHRTRKEDSFTPDCLHQQIFIDSTCRYRSVSQNGLRSFTYRNATHPQSVSAFP